MNLAFLRPIFQRLLKPNKRRRYFECASGRRKSYTTYRPIKKRPLGTKKNIVYTEDVGGGENAV